MAIEVHPVFHRSTHARPALRSRADAPAEAHAEEWLAAWNAHDVEAIANCCADDVVLVANGIARRWSGRYGSLRGKQPLREHFTRRLERAPGLRLTREAVLVTPGGYALLYRRENGDRALETIELNGEDLAARVTAFDERA